MDFLTAIQTVLNFHKLAILFSLLTTYILATTVVPDLTTQGLSSLSPVHDNETLDNSTTNGKEVVTTAQPDFSYLEACPENAPCENLGAACIDCNLNHYCLYGRQETCQCTVKPNITCIGSRTFSRPYQCRYAYQLDMEMLLCDTSLVATSCNMKMAPPETYIGQCQVKDEVLCLGNRTFHKRFPCNWTRGYKWSTSLILSITLGGFGVDRFYLGSWREGIGKLFSFGGLGVWTLVDVILIAVGYIGPYDGSLFIYPWN